MESRRDTDQLMDSKKREGNFFSELKEWRGIAVLVMFGILLYCVGTMWFMEEVDGTYISTPQHGQFRFIEILCDGVCTNPFHLPLEAKLTFETMFFFSEDNIIELHHDDQTNIISFGMSETFMQESFNKRLKSGVELDVISQVWTQVNFTESFIEPPNCTLTGSNGLDPRTLKVLNVRDITESDFEIFQESQANVSIDVYWICSKTTD